MKYIIGLLWHINVFIYYIHFIKYVFISDKIIYKMKLQVIKHESHFVIFSKIYYNLVKIFEINNLILLQKKEFFLILALLGNNRFYTCKPH